MITSTSISLDINVYKKGKKKASKDKIPFSKYVNTLIEKDVGGKK